jgi:ribonuclease PH
LRSDNRKDNEIRELHVLKDVQEQSDGSCLISLGNTRVLCAVRFDNKVPSFLRGSGEGWITAEYSMLPGSTNTRTSRNNINSGRTKEIQRLIGRSIRSAIDLTQIGENTLLIDCDVINADGGTRTAAITGSFIALNNAIKKLQAKKILSNNINVNAVAAISVGLMKNNIILDLNYEEDSKAIADFNFVMDENKNIIEIQGTGESGKFTQSQLMKALDMASISIKDIINIQKKYLD